MQKGEKERRTFFSKIKIVEKRKREREKKEKSLIENHKKSAQLYTKYKTKYIHR